MNEKKQEAPEYMERDPAAQEFVDRLAMEVFGRKPKKGQCVFCGSEKMAPEDFRDEISLRESRISYQCQPCQDKTDAMSKALSECEDGEAFCLECYEVAPEESFSEEGLCEGCLA